jgi:hypothetical protein
MHILVYLVIAVYLAVLSYGGGVCYPKLLIPAFNVSDGSGKHCPEIIHIQVKNDLPLNTFAKGGAVAFLLNHMLMIEMSAKKLLHNICRITFAPWIGKR